MEFISFEGFQIMLSGIFQSVSFVLYSQRIFIATLSRCENPGNVSVFLALTDGQLNFEKWGQIFFRPDIACSVFVDGFVVYA